MQMAELTGTGVTEREIGPNFAQLSEGRKEFNRRARSPAVRKARFHERLEIAKRASAIIADPQWKKKLAAAEAAIFAAKKEYDAANAPFERLEKARAGLHGAESARNGIEAGRKSALVALQREADRSEDYILSEIANELQRALDEAMKSRSGNAEANRKRLQRAIEVASKMPYEFRGSWQKYEALLVGLKKLAESRGCEAMASPQWGDDEAILGETE